MSLSYGCLNSFDFSGKVIVNISETDYKAYKDKYKFDQLCESLADVFKIFLHDFKNGNTQKILADLRSVESGYPKQYSTAMSMLSILLVIISVVLFILQGRISFVFAAIVILLIIITLINILNKRKLRFSE